jgi:hypothetical protein
MLHDTVIYQESTVSRVSFWITVVLVLVMVLGVVFWGNFRTLEGRLVFWGCTSSASIALFVGLSFTQLVVTVTQSRLILAFGLFKRAFDRERIVSVEPTDLRLSESRGYGIRRGRDRKRYWVTAPGPGLKVEVTDAKNDKVLCYVFSSAHPRRLANILDVAWRS